MFSENEFSEIVIINSPCECQQEVPLLFSPIPSHPSPTLPLASAGAEGGLDFGVVRVMEEVKQPLQLKNRGKYEIMFR